jgi:hypothetical protein
VRALVGLAGLILGILLGVGLVLANPLAWFKGLPPLATELAPPKAYRWADSRGVSLRPADLLGLGRPRPGVAFVSPALAQVRLGIVVLPAGDGTPAALAVKVSVIAGENSLWRAQLGTHDYWNVFWPGEGSVFAAGYSNYWGAIRDEVFSAVGSPEPNLLADGYPVSAPSPLRNSTGVTGAAGRFAGFTGEIREFLYPSEDGENADWALALKSNPPPVTAR